MIELFKSKEQEKEFISEYANPFRSDKVTRISLWIGPNPFTRVMEFEGKISFKNGNSSGDQKIIGVDFPDLVKKVELFIKSL